jgi:hypothetical protein
MARVRRSGKIAVSAASEAGVESCAGLRAFSKEAISSITAN